MQSFAIWLITQYQKYLSPDQGFLPRLFNRSKPTCIFYPTCSDYAKEAITLYGVWKGGRMALSRIGRCNPLSEPRVDLVPKPEGK